MTDPAQAPATKKSEVTFYCSYCSRSQHDIQKLIAGVGGAFICDECVGLCVDILAKEKISPSTQFVADLAKLNELREEIEAVITEIDKGTAPLRLEYVSMQVRLKRIDALKDKLRGLIELKGAAEPTSLLATPPLKS